MFGKLSIIGCGLIGSSILRAAQGKKLASKISQYDWQYKDGIDFCTFYLV